MNDVAALATKSGVNLSGPGKRARFTDSMRLLRHSDFERVYKKGRRHFAAHMSVFYLLREQGEGLRIGFTVGKVLGQAHQRNRIKRRMREALRCHVDLLPQGFDLILHPRRSVLTMEFAKLEAEIVRILEQAMADAARSDKPSAVLPKANVTPAP